MTRAIFDIGLGIGCLALIVYGFIVLFEAQRTLKLIKKALNDGAGGPTA